MDLVVTLRNKIQALQGGAHMSGLLAVLRHIETSENHFSRGQTTGDDAAFTDAIYRTNQAFEGSVKEAYRVLTGKDPARQTPHNIEKYLEENNIFRDRVLKQLTTYRTEWRNPSTHNYQLDFDEDEAFLAIANVSAFACLLLDQIAEELSFQQAKASAQAVNTTNQAASWTNLSIVEASAALIQKFSATALPQPLSNTPLSEAHFIGALHGFFSTAAPEMQVEIDKKLSLKDHSRADLYVMDRGHGALIEIKRASRMNSSRLNVKSAIDQVEHYMQISGTKDAILFFVPEENCELERQDIEIPSVDGRIVVLRPAKN